MDLQSVLTALRNADAAGDVQAAQRLAQIAKNMQGAAPQFDEEDDRIQRRLEELRNFKEAPKTTFGGNVKEAFKGVIPGAVGLLETAGTGIAALLPEDTEKAAREKIKEIAGVAKKPFEAGAGYEQSTGRQIGEGLGSMLAVAPMALMGPAGVVGGVGVGLAAGAGEARERAEREGATGSQRGTATALGAIPGGFDTAIDMALAAFPGGAGKALGFIRRALLSGGVEGATEAAQEIAQNAIAKGVYKPDQSLLSGAGEAGVTGAEVGTIASLLLDMAIPGRRRGPSPITGEKPSTPETPAATAPAETRAPTAEMPQGELFPGELSDAQKALADVVGPAKPEAVQEETKPVSLRGVPEAEQDAVRGLLQENFKTTLDPETGDVRVEAQDYEAARQLLADVGVKAPDTRTERDTETRDMIDELETADIEKMVAEDESAKLRELITERDKAIAETDKRVAESQKTRSANERMALLEPLVKSEVPNLQEVFVQKLEREGYTNTQPTEAEAKIIEAETRRAKINSLIDRYFSLKPKAAPETGVEPSAPAENAEMEALIPEKKTRREPEQIGFPGMGKPKGKAPQAFSEEELAGQEAPFTGRSGEAPRSHTSTEPFVTTLTADVLDKTGLPKQSGFYKQLLNLDMADKANWPVMREVFGRVRTNANIKPATKDAIENIAMQAFGGMAKQQELFPEGKKGAKAEKPAKPAKEKPSETAGGRDQDKGNDRGATGTRTVTPEPSVSKPKAAERPVAAKPTEAPKPAGLGDRGQPVRDAGKREKVEPSALKEAPKTEPKKAKPTTENAYQTSVELGEKEHAIRTLAADAYMAMMPEGYGAKRAATLLKDLNEGKAIDLKFGPLNANGPGTGGKHGKAFYDSLNDADKAAFNKEFEKFLHSEIGSIKFLNKFEQKLLDNRIEDDAELTADAVRIFMPLSPQVEADLKAGDLSKALTSLAGKLTSRDAKVGRALLDAVKGVKVEIVEGLKSPSGRPLAGLYDQATNTVKLDAEMGMNAHALLHEATHAAVLKTLANKSHPMTKQLSDMFAVLKPSLDTVYGAKSLDEFVSEAFSNPEFQQRLAAINPKGEPISALRRFFNAVGNFLRSLVGMPTKGLDSALDATDALVMRIIAPNGVPVGSMYQASMLGTAQSVFKAMDAQVLSMPVMDNAFVGGIYDVLREKIPNLTKTTILRSLPLNALTDVAAKVIPMAKKLDTLEKQWGGAIDERRRAVDATYSNISKWTKGNPEKESALNDLVMQSTLEEVDPSKARDSYKGKSTKSDKDKQAVWDSLQAKWKELGPEGQAIYKQMRDAYAETHEQLINLLFSRIDSSVKDPKEAEKLRKEIYQRLAVKGKIEPYFPLMRQGDHWVTFNAKNADGQMEYYKVAFQNSVEQARAIRELKADPNVDVKSVQKSSPTGKRTYRDAPPTSFVNSIIKVLDANRPKGEDGARHDMMVDEIMRVFLDTLPESSFAQSFRARLGTLGAMTDAADVFYSKSISMAHQLANLEYGAKMYKLRDEMQEYVDTKDRTEEARMLFDTMDRHIKSMVSPDISPFAKLATSTAFGWTLGFNVSSALVNTTQLPMVVMPYLGGKYGYGDANKAIGAATRLFFGSGRKRKAKTVGGGDPVELTAGYSIDNYDFLGFDTAVAAHIEKVGKAPTEAERMQIAKKLGMSKEVLELKELSDLSSQYGLLSRSMTSDVLETGKADGPLTKINAWSGFVFHHGERMNRQVSMIAAYRLELDRMRKANGGKELTAQDRTAAAEEAIRSAELLNGGASANSAPLLAKNSVGKMVFMYKRYGVSMYYMLFQTTRDAMVSEDPDVRKAAKRQIAGIYASTALLAGVQGVPMFGIVAALYNLIFKDDDDDDFETAARKYMGEGKFNGALNYFTGTAVANRIGLTDLLMHDTGYRNQDNAVLGFLQLFGGPVYGVADRLTRGAKLMMDGETMRGMEQLMPAAAGNAFKAWRFANEGANTLRGDPITGEVGIGHSLAQAVGFAPADYMRQLEENAVEKNVERRTLEKRTNLLRKYYVALRAGDSDAASDYMEELVKLGQKHPGLVTPTVIKNSLAQHMRTTATMYHGVTFNKLMRNELLANAAEFDRDVSVFDDDGE